MLAQIISTSVNSINLGARDHAALGAGSEALYAEVHKRDRHTCRGCGFRIFEGLEIDHLAGHKPAKAKDLGSICQFCHNLKHPIWSAARKKIVPIFAPDLSQSDLNRLAWTILAWRDVPDAPFAADKLLNLIDRRRGRFEDVMHCSSAESLFEAALTISDRSQLGRKVARGVLEGIDGFTRYWPSELTPEFEDLTPASRLSRWNAGGFTVIADVVAERILADLKPEPEKIQALMSKLEVS